jgi:hypothetical protein
VNYDELSCSEIVFRALIYATWVDNDTGRVMPAAFIRRQHESGLSIGLRTSAKDFCKRRFNGPTYGVGTLHVGRVRDIVDADLDVIRDADDHATLTGIPLATHDKTKAERLASLLSKQARWVHED